MDKVQLFEAKARLSELVDRAEQGRETVITRNGRAVARLVPERSKRSRAVNAEVIDEIIAFSKTYSTGRRFNIRKLIEAGRR